MKFSHVLPLAAFSTALVLPTEEVFSEVSIESNHRGDSLYDRLVKEKDAVLDSVDRNVVDKAENTWDELYDGSKKAIESSKSALDAAFEYATEKGQDWSESLRETAFDVNSWLQTETEEMYDAFESTLDDPHHGPPHHRRPHHPPHHGEPNQTVYQLISESKYTTKLAKLINKYDDLVDALNSTEANYTVFAPTDKAFAKIPEHAPEPSKEQLKQLLSYHVVDGFYPTGRVLVTHTAPTLLQGEHLSDEAKPQRIAFKITLRGLTVNFYSRIIAVNIFGTNGVIHGVDSIILPPPRVMKIIDLLPSEFSTLELGLGKTGLFDKLNTTDHAGGTFFAPSNFAFQKLGPRINAFLFSPYGLKYLKALLKYHLVPANTLYSDAYYQASSESSTDDYRIPKGLFHVDLPTMLEDKSLSVDIARYGGLIEMKINAFARVAVQDGIAEDGVIHVVSDVIIPPKKLGDETFWTGEEMSVEELKERLEPFVDNKLDL